MSSYYGYPYYGYGYGPYVGQQPAAPPRQLSPYEALQYMEACMRHLEAQLPGAEEVIGLTLLAAFNRAASEGWDRRRAEANVAEIISMSALTYPKRR
jgi:hypothetical protein